MKIIYDNIIFSLQKVGGISLYWYELTKRLKAKEDITFFESGNQNIFRKEFDLDTVHETNLSVRLLRYLPFSKKLPEKAIFHSSYYRVSLQRSIVNITTVHDFTYEYYRTGIAKYIHIWQKNFAIKNSDGIICVSENTKKDLIRFLPNIDYSKIRVIYNGVGKEFKKLSISQQYLEKEFTVLNNKKYILYIGDRSSYKNFGMAVETIKNLKNYYFVIVGGQELNRHELQNMEDIKNRVFHFRGIEGDKLNILYNNAFCLLYPSSYEGFGIPILESMRAECPVISTNTSSIVEVAGKAALLVDEINVKSFVKKIQKLEDDDLRNELILKGLVQSKKFSWDKCFEETYDFYTKIWNKRFEN